MTARAAVAAVMLVLMLGVPAIAGPLAEVPGTHWAYSALSRLVAEGSVEGYPLGAFRGHRAMTRYELAVVVSRVLVRIESRPSSEPKIIRRLVAEFEAELDTLGIAVPRRERPRAPAGPSEGGAAGRRADPLQHAGMTFTGSGGRVADSALRFAPPDRARDPLSLHGHVSMRDPLRDPLAAAVDGARPSMPTPGMSLVAQNSEMDGLRSDWALASGVVAFAAARARPAVPGWPPPMAFDGTVRWSLATGESPAAGLQTFADWATWSRIPSLDTMSPAGTSAARFGTTLDLSRLGIDAWRANLSVAYLSYMPPAPDRLVTTLSPATSFFGPSFDWSTLGLLARLDLSFTPRTSGAVLYEGGQVIMTGQLYTGWALRMAHQMAPNATVAVHYYRTRCGVAGGTPCPGFTTPGQVDRFYRAELLYSW